MTFEKELEELINKHSIENESDTPDFILAQYLIGCLDNFKSTINAREIWDKSPAIVPRSSAEDDSELADVDEQSREDGVKKCPKCDGAGYLCNHPELPFFGDECPLDINCEDCELTKCPDCEGGE